MAEEFDTPEHGPLRENGVLWRLTIWGSAATVAVAAAVLITQSDLGVDRLLQAMSAPEKPQIMAQDDLAKRVETQRLEENRRLEARIRELINDREKLNSRIATLEQNFGDLTGSIKRDMAAIQASAKPLAPPPAATPAPMLTAPPATVTPPPAEPAASNSDAKAAPKPEAKPEVKPEAKLEPKSEARVTPPAEAPAPQAPPQVVNVPMPQAAPTRMAAAPTTTPDEKKNEVGIELGGARSMDILNARWSAVKANFGPLIEGMSPLMRHDDKGNIPYRLIVGPVANRATAAQLCARFAQSKVSCTATSFSGEKFVQ